jgi:lysophospholipid acyltransferase (LPLAT)-like uncharacterized protein
LKLTDDKDFKTAGGPVGNPAATGSGGEGLDRLYRFASLEQYDWRQRLVIRLAGVILYWLIMLIGRTVRFKVIGAENDHPQRPQVICFWHNRIPVGTWYFRRRAIVVMSSLSFDSEYIARFIQRFGYGAARGSSTRGAKAALIQMIRAVRAGRSVGFSVDGPRGPVYVAKPGPLLLAAQTGAPIIPFSVSLEKCWRLRSWDRIEIPKPFSRAIAVIGDPIYVEVGNDRAELERLQQALEEVRDRGDLLLREIDASGWPGSTPS